MRRVGVRRSIALVFILAATHGCASKSADDLAKAFDRAKAKMTLAEVEQVLGPGEEITKEQLPENFAKVYTLEPTFKYHRWVRQIEHEKATLFVAFQDGKLTSQRLVEKESITTGRGAK